MRINRNRLDKAISTIKGFTLIELIIVIAIIAVTSAIMIPNVIGQRRIAKIQAANDGAYTVYVATQDYLNNLQKRGLDAKKYFGKSGKFGKGLLTYQEEGIGFLSVNGGVLEPVTNSKAYNTSNGKMNAADRPEEAYLRQAFAGICKRLGKDCIKDGDAEYNQYRSALSAAGVEGQPLSAEMNAAGESFLIEVYPDKYTVRCVYYTTYMTNKTDYTGYGTDDIFRRVFCDHNDLRCDNGVQAQKYLSVSGFASVRKTGNKTFSQEYVAERAGFQKMGDTYAPAYVGQYPIPAYK